MQIHEQRLMDLLKTYDYETYRHSVRVSNLLVSFGRYLSVQETELKQLKRIGLLHDIGKIYIEEAVLQKKLKFTENEWQLMKRHPIYGYELLKEKGTELEILIPVLHHHENFDGTGYPSQIEGEKISHFARMLRIVDSFDAMTVNRIYKTCKSNNEAITELLNGSSTMYDPTLTEAYLEMLADRKIKSRMSITHD